VADVGFGLPPQSAMRSCLVATALARRMGLAEDDVRDAFYVALLMHFGCVALSHETAAAFGDELVVTRAVARTNLGDPGDMAATLIPAITAGMSEPARARTAEFAAGHGAEFGRRYDSGSCEVARDTARRIGLPASTQRALYEVSESWSGGWAPRGIAGDEIALPARIVRAAADAAFFAEIEDGDGAVAALWARAGGVLDPAVVETFVADARSLLTEADAGDPRERILEVEPEPVVERDQRELSEVAAAVGDLADLKSPFLHGHSKGVARLATAAATRAGLAAAAVSRLEVAALLHDVGRVGISNAIWEKPGPLTRAEWEQVRLHGYHAERILATSPTLEPMAAIAGMDHERLDGSGYHRGSNAGEIPVAARLLAAADVYQAMTQRRPHRDALTPTAASDELRREAKAGRLDADAVAAVLDAAGHRGQQRPSDLRPGGLSDREIEVLALVAEGCSNPQIAERLYIARRTAEHHVQHIYAKIGVATRAGAALFALQHDLLAK